jgi:hypothetical protein
MTRHLHALPDPARGEGWPAWLARVHTDCAFHGADVPPIDQLADEYVHRMAQLAALDAWVETQQEAS